MELKQISGNTWCLSGHQIIPLYRTDSSHCILMDTGPYALREELERDLARYGLTPIGLLCTHTHFDHFGNTRYLSERFNCPVALPLGEAEICRTLASVKSHLYVYSAGQVASDPEHAPDPLPGGHHVIRPEETDTLFRGVRFRVLHTPGHAMDHAAYITPDNVCYIGDALMCGRTLHTSRLPYAFNFQQSLDTIRSLKGLDCQAMAVAHCGVLYEGFDALVEENLQVMERQLAEVRALVDQAHVLRRDLRSRVPAHGGGGQHREEGPESGAVPAALYGVSGGLGQPPAHPAGQLPVLRAGGVKPEGPRRETKRFCQAEFQRSEAFFRRDKCRGKIPSLRSG